MSTAGRDETLVEYLLGGLSSPVREELEARLLAEGELDEDLLATTDELIEAYLRGKLTPADRLRFERHFLLTPGHRDRLAFGRSLLEGVDALSASEGRAASNRRAIPARWLRGLAAAALVAAFALLWYRAAGPVADTDPRQSVERTPPTPTVVAPDNTKAASLPGTKAPSPVQVVRLGDTGSAVRLTVASDTRLVRLQAIVDVDSPSFDASLRSAEGKLLWRTEGIAPSTVGGPLTMDVPSALLVAGAYTVHIHPEEVRAGGPVAQEYSLVVVRAASPSPAATR